MISWLWWLQLGLDLVLLAALSALIWRLGGLARISAGLKPPDLEAFVNEAQELSAEFDRLLGEKRKLISGALDSLDERIARLRQMGLELEQTALAAARVKQAVAKPPPEPAPEPRGDQEVDIFRRKVLKLADNGKTAAEISEITGHPRGEVELVLGLSGR